jgi:hypothetical protein
MGSLHYGVCVTDTATTPLVTIVPDCDHPESATTSGLVAYLDGEPVGWCAVEPRTAYPRLLLRTRVRSDDGERYDVVHLAIV